jgi:hypothetical protein
MSVFNTVSSPPFVNMEVGDALTSTTTTAEISSAGTAAPHQGMSDNCIQTPQIPAPTMPPRLPPDTVVPFGIAIEHQAMLEDPTYQPVLPEGINTKEDLAAHIEWLSKVAAREAAEFGAD